MKKQLIKLIQWLYITRTKWNANRLHFNKAIKQAEKLANPGGNRTGKRTYIYFLGGKYRVVNRKQVQYLKGAGVIKHSINLQKLQKICLYDTQGSVNTHPIYR